MADSTWPRRGFQNPDARGRLIRALADEGCWREEWRGDAQNFEWLLDALLEELRKMANEWHGAADDWVGINKLIEALWNEDRLPAP